MTISAVIIGKDEGERLIKCLDAAMGHFDEIIYVDSGSKDHSVAEAKKRDVQVVELDMSRPFTAARARNAGMEALQKKATFIQFLDGDCILDKQWIKAAVALLDQRTDVAAVNGILAELKPDASIYNLICDIEWSNTPGEIEAIAGVSLFRADAITKVGGFDPDVHAGEEGELCLRLKELGWKFWNIDVPMAQHDAAIYKFGTWWKRCVRHGQAIYLEREMHKDNVHYRGPKTILRAIFWAAVLPLSIITIAIFSCTVAVLLLLVYPLQILRMALKTSLPFTTALKYSSLMMLSKFAELCGMMDFALKNRKMQLK